MSLEFLVDIFPLTRIRHQGIGVPSDPARAREMYEEACEAGSSAAAYFLGQRFHAGDKELGIEKDGARALQLLRRSSEQVRVLTAVSFTWVPSHTFLALLRFFPDSIR